MGGVESREKVLGTVTWWILLGLLSIAACSGPDSSFEAPGVNLVADPNPIQVCDGTGLGQTQIAWFREELETVQLRIGAPDGRLFVRGGAHGTAETGPWVKDGTTVYLLDDPSGEVLAHLTLHVSTAECKP